MSQGSFADDRRSQRFIWLEWLRHWVPHTEDARRDAAPGDQIEAQFATAGRCRLPVERLPGNRHDAVPCPSVDPCFAAYLGTPGNVPIRRNSRVLQFAGGERVRIDARDIHDPGIVGLGFAGATASCEGDRETRRRIDLPDEIRNALQGCRTALIQAQVGFVAEVVADQQRSITVRLALRDCELRSRAATVPTRLGDVETDLLGAPECDRIGFDDSIETEMPGDKEILRTSQRIQLAQKNRLPDFCFQRPYLESFCIRPVEDKGGCRSGGDGGKQEEGEGFHNELNEFGDAFHYDR